MSPHRLPSSVVYGGRATASLVLGTSGLVAALGLLEDSLLPWFWETMCGHGPLALWVSILRRGLYTLGNTCWCVAVGRENGTAMCLLHTFRLHTI